MTQYPYQNSNLSATARVDDLLRRMSLAEKIGQMTQIEKNSLAPADVTAHLLGSVLSGGGGYPTSANTRHAWREMVVAFQQAALQTRLAIPIIYGVDAVHGHNNMHGAVLFPHNIGLGATRDAHLVERVGQVTANEVLATNVHWNFAPAVSVPHDIRWGRTFEGYSQDTDLVTALGEAYVRGLHAGGVLASVKHFVGDGGTSWNSTSRYSWLPYMWNAPDDRWSIDQGITDVDEATLRRDHLRPYAAAIAAGARNIMVSYSSWGGIKMHRHHYLLTDVLKGEMGFQGFLVSDFKAIDQLDQNYYTCVVESINAGMDMIMVPHDVRLFIDNLTQAVANGDVPLSRIDDAVRRILLAKFELGLFEQPFTDLALLDQIGSEAHRAVAREAVQKSLVLLKNDAVLPLAKGDGSIIVAGIGADDIGLQCGGWSIEWQGKQGPITPGGTIWQGIQAAAAGHAVYRPDGQFQDDTMADTGIVVIAEKPYAEGEGDRADLALTAADISLISRVRPHCRRLVLILLSGRPLIVTDVLHDCDAFVAAWLPGTEGQAIAGVLFGDVPFSGRLPHAWPRDMSQVPLASLVASAEAPLFPFGYGLVTD